jgi:neutral trehalase
MREQLLKKAGEILNKRDFPKIHFYDQDFVDIYDKTWNWLSDFWIDTESGEQSNDGLFVYPINGKFVLDQAEAIFSSFFLVYSNRNYPANKNIDFFYERQEENGAIRWKYDAATKEAIFDKKNPEGVGLPLFAWAEFNLYHKSANKRRISTWNGLTQLLNSRTDFIQFRRNAPPCSILRGKVHFFPWISTAAWQSM